MAQWGRIRIAYAASSGALALFVACLACPPRLDAQIAVDPTFAAARAAVIDGLSNNVGTLPSPSGGALTFRLDPTVGVFTRDSDTLGPIFTDRYQTTGKNRLTITGSYTRHTFDEVDGLDVRKDGIQVLLAAPGRLNQIEVKEEADVDVGSIGALFGVTDTIDVGLTIPILRVKLKERVTRTFFFDCVDSSRAIGCSAPVTRNDPFLTQSSDATGIGDIALRGKYNFWQTSGTTGRMGSAFVLEVTLPTGDTGDKDKLRNPQIIVGPSGTPQDSQFTFGDPPLGTGIVRVKPRLVFSGEMNPGLGLAIGAHTFVGGELGTTEGITNDLVYGFGLDLAPQVAFLSTIQLTLVADFLGRHAFDVNRKRLDLLSSTPFIPGQTFDDFVRGIPTADSDTFTGSFGLKATPLAGLGSNLLAQLVVFVNFLVPLNDTGFRDGLTPTVGLEWNYAF